MTYQDNPWARLSGREQRPGEKCGQCHTCRYGLPGDWCENDPRWKVEPQSDGHTYTRLPNGAWRRNP